jgi:acetolactate synthase-1/2/3 large subunit
MKRSGSEIFWETITREGVETVFGYPGGAIMPIYDVMLDYPIHHVLSRHEQGAVHMADGFARAGGGVGVALATSGPGGTNMVTGIATAMLDSSPIVCVTGQVVGRLLGYDAFQEVDISGITLPITKHNYMVTDVHELGQALREAFYIARTGRPGPVLIDLPKDVQIAEIDWEYNDDPVFLPGYKFSPPPLSNNELDKTLEMIQNARKPIILAGQGVLKSNAFQELRQFAEKAQIPVTTTLLGIGAFPASHPLNLGMMGMHGEAYANIAIQESDLLLAFGMRFDDRVTGNISKYATGAKKIHVEIDPSEIDKNVQVDLGIISDLRKFLVDLLPRLDIQEHNEWISQLEDLKSETAALDIKNQPDDGCLHAAHVIYDLWKATEGNALVVSDVGQNQMWTAQYYKQEKPFSVATSGGLGTMGFALPAAIGAKFARPEEEVWVTVGDGGFQMTQAELATAKQEGIKVNIAIINNGYLGMVRQWQELFFDRRYASTPITGPDFVKIAEAHGLKGLRVTQRSEVETAIRKAQGIEGTALIDFRVEQEDGVYPMVPAGSELQGMIRRPTPDQMIEQT